MCAVLMTAPDCVNVCFAQCIRNSLVFLLILLAKQTNYSYKCEIMRFHPSLSCVKYSRNVSANVMREKLTRCEVDTV